MVAWLLRLELIWVKADQIIVVYVCLLNLHRHLPISSSVIGNRLRIAAGLVCCHVKAAFWTRGARKSHLKLIILLLGTALEILYACVSNLVLVIGLHLAHESVSLELVCFSHVICLSADVWVKLLLVLKIDDISGDTSLHTRLKCQMLAFNIFLLAWLATFIFSRQSAQA